LCLQTLQLIQNDTAFLVFNLTKFSHIISYQVLPYPLPCTFHWLPVEAHIIFKTLLIAYKAAKGTAPPYLQGIVKPYTPT
jgi:hypothetical protein